MALVTRRCPNADIRVEGKTFFNSGHWVVRCRAANGQEIAPNVANDMCLSGTCSSFGSSCNLCCGSTGNQKIDESKAGWKRCRHSGTIYGW